MQPLPIDAQVPAALAAARQRGALVLTAPPGAGKSTRIPPALVNALTGQVYLLQPRRVAARALARRIAEEQGWQLGREVGWRVRFERLGGKDTRLWVMTEGSLTRQLQDDPYLDGVGAVILDEFHERSLHTDLCLAWCAELKRTLRPDLVIVVMSATMDAQPVSRFLDDAPVVEIQAPTFPVTLRLANGRDGWGRDDQRLDERVAAAVREAIADPECGDLLVFLPGVGEIRAAQHALSGMANDQGLAVLPLHGSLSAQEQDAAIAPATDGRRKVVLSTNVAETSLTIPGVRTVIDAGTARVARFNPDSGLDELRLEPISRASAIQRAGRAGRTAPGRCWRLWSQLHDHRMAAHGDPEIARVDLAPTLLTLKPWHGADPRTFPWFERPSDERLAHGEALLADLGATRGPCAALTPLGERMVRLPIHPRLARLLDLAATCGASVLGAELAALIGERDLRPPWRPGDRPVDPDRADALDRLACLRRAEAVGFRPSLRSEGIDPQAARETAKVRDDLMRLIRGDGGAAHSPSAQRPVPSAQPPAASDEAALVCRLLLAAYPDRLAKRTAPTANRALMVGGIAVEIDRGSCLTAPTGKPRPELFCAYAVQGVGQGGRHATMVRQGAELDEAEVEAVFPGAIQRRELVSYDQQRQTVSTVVGWYYHDLCLRANPGAQVDAARIATCLADALASQARALFDEDEEAASFLRRAAWLRVQCPELAVPAFADAALAELVLSLCAGCRSRNDVVAKPKLPWLTGGLPHATTRAIDDQAPATLLVPTGNRIKLQYDDPARPPVLAVRLQELFGQRETPRIANGRVAVLLHLLGPNYRAEQVTQDLASFWRNTYPQVRKDLRSRYPKHAWPEDPLNAAPVARGRPVR